VNWVFKGLHAILDVGLHYERRMARFHHICKRKLPKSYAERNLVRIPSLPHHRCMENQSHPPIKRYDSMFTDWVLELLEYYSACEPESERLRRL
jgi:hypothetical protein